MNKQLIQETEQHIGIQYKELLRLMLDPDSYHIAQIKVDQIQNYLNFLEGALQRPYNRIAHLHAFLSDPDGLMVARMYPFGLLSAEAKTNILALYQKTERLAGALYVSLPDAGRVLENEPHELEGKNK